MWSHPTACIQMHTCMCTEPEGFCWKPNVLKLLLIESLVEMWGWALLAIPTMLLCNATKRSFLIEIQQWHKMPSLWLFSKWAERGQKEQCRALQYRNIHWIICSETCICCWRIPCYIPILIGQGFTFKMNSASARYAEEFTWVQHVGCLSGMLQMYYKLKINLSNSLHVNFIWLLVC